MASVEQPRRPNQHLVEGQIQAVDIKIEGGQVFGNIVEGEISLGNGVQVELPECHVTQRFDHSANRVSNLAAGGMDAVEISFQSRAQAAEFLRVFWPAMGHTRAQFESDDDILQQTTHRCDRTDFVDYGDGSFELCIHGNWEPLTETAKNWLKANTKLIGSLD